MERFYEAETEAAMKRVYDSFSEKDKRLYAAIEVKKLPYGGFSYISNILDCSPPTLYEGLKELETLEERPQDRVRRPGGGRKRIIEITEQIDEVFLAVVGEHTAGDPMREKVIWTDLRPAEVAELMCQSGIEVTAWVVEQLFEKHGYARRSALKSVSTGASEQRNEQFENIARLKEEYQQQGNPVISMDAKKKKF